jgi:hypothetical protein
LITIFFNGQLAVSNEYYCDTILPECGFYLVGAASSREYRMGAALSRFIAAGSRSHKDRRTQLITKVPLQLTSSFNLK